jgi:hypothetical protein
LAKTVRKNRDVLTAVVAVIGRKRLRGGVPVRGSAERDLVCGAEPVPGTHDRFPCYRR